MLSFLSTAYKIGNIVSIFKGFIYFLATFSNYFDKWYMLFVKYSLLKMSKIHKKNLSIWSHWF